MKLLSSASRYWHTIKYLRPVQIYGRLWFRYYRPRLQRTELPSPRVGNTKWAGAIGKRQSMLAPDTFRFLNKERRLSTAGGWNDPHVEKLWLYNLHYFDDLTAEGAASRTAWHEALLGRWVSENPAGQGNGWEPYPTSLRIVNWIKWTMAGNTLPAHAIESLALQARWLACRLERHLLGNHLFANAKALVFAGLFFEGREADRWLRLGLKIIEKELPEQVLADGGNFERSPMYHAIFLEDVLDLINLGRLNNYRVAASKIGAWREVAGSMLDWMAGMTHPDGKIALFNDAATNIAATFGQLTAYAAQMGIESRIPAAWSTTGAELRHWPQSGYVQLLNGPAVAYLDVAPIGPDYLPGHAHADTLSFELSVFGHRLIVNGGTSQYGDGIERLRERGTAAHSTVEIDGVDSSEVWGGFRVARRARPFDLALRRDSDNLTVSCAHDGYARLSGRPVHRRHWQMSGAGLTVRDSVTSKGRHEAIARFILHPDVRCHAHGASVWHLDVPGKGTVRFEVFKGIGRSCEARYSEEFGKSAPTQALEVRLTEGVSEVRMSW